MPLYGSNVINVDDTVDDAVTEWWTQPISTYLETPYPRVVTGAISSTGEILVCENNLVTDKTKRVVAGSAQVDDHNVPALYAEPGRRFLLAWSNHDSGNAINFKCSGVNGNIQTFEGAATVTLITAALTTYVQLIKIDSLSSASEDIFWLLHRAASSTWGIIPVTVTQATGAVTFGTEVIVFSAPGRQSYITIADAHVSSGNQKIRCAWGYNPTLTIHAIFGFEIDVVTGAITNVADSTFTANMNGTNLPITETVPPTAFIAEPASGNSRRLFYVRPGPDSFAVAYADWATASPDAATYKVKEIAAPGQFVGLKRLTINGGSANAAYTAAMQMNAFIVEEFFTLSGTPSATVELARRQGIVISTVHFMMRINTTRTVTVIVDTIGGRYSLTTTATVPGNWTDRIGLRLVVNDALTPKLGIYYSQDDGATWNLLEGTNPAELASGALATAADITLPHYSTQSELLSIQSFYLKTAASAIVAGVDFLYDWPYAGTTYTDAQGIVWTLSGSNVYVNAAISELGISGARVGYTEAANYIAGMAFQNPSEDKVVYTAHTDGSVETIKKHRLGAGTSETLVTGPTTAGRLIRPYSPINSNPIDLTYNTLTHYTAYTDFLGNIKKI